MTKNLKSILLTIPAAVFLLLGLSTAAVYAQDGGGSSSSSSSSSSSGGGSTGDSTSNIDQYQNRKAAQELLAGLRKEHKEHTTAQRQKYCQAAKHGLETKLTKLGKNAVAFQARIDKIFAKAQTYQSKNNIQVTNWDVLLATAQAAQTKAASSVATLQALNVNLDCTSSTVADNVATFKAAAKQARTDLHAYKSAVKDILKALEAAKDQEGTQ